MLSNQNNPLNIVVMNVIEKHHVYNFLSYFVLTAAAYILSVWDAQWPVSFLFLIDLIPNNTNHNQQKNSSSNTNNNADWERSWIQCLFISCSIYSRLSRLSVPDRCSATIPVYPLCLILSSRVLSCLCLLLLVCFVFLFPPSLIS